MRFLKAVETFDYRNQRYKFDVTLGVRLVPRLLPQLDQFFREALARAHVERSENTIIFDLTRIFTDLTQDESFRRALEELLKSDQLRQALRYKDDDTQAFIAQIRGFAVNQYSVNAVIGSIIERAVVPEIRKVLDTRHTVTVTCEGGADRLRFNGTLAYSGKGRVATKGTPLPLDSEEGRPLKDGIRDNLALSFARGYAGAKALAELLGDLSTNKRVQVRYTGLGEVADRAGNHPESRRIIFRLDLGQKIK